VERKPRLRRLQFHHEASQEIRPRRRPPAAGGLGERVERFDLEPDGAPDRLTQAERAGGDEAPPARGASRRHAGRVEGDRITRAVGHACASVLQGAALSSRNV